MPKIKTTKTRTAARKSDSRSRASQKPVVQKSRQAKASSAKRSGSSGNRTVTGKKALVAPKPVSRSTGKPAKKAASRKIVLAKPVSSKLKAKVPAGKRIASAVKSSSRKASSPVVRQALPKVQPAPPPEIHRRQAASGVVRAFEHAVRVFNRRDFAEAKSLFENLLNRYPQEVEVIARAQIYLQVCSQKLAHKPSSPRNADELYDRGVFALNIGDFPQARNFFEKALRLRPNEPHVLYSLAITHAQSGTHELALDYLTRSIQMQPRLRSQALNDTDFSGLREDKRFLELTGISSLFDLLESRR